MKLEGRTVLITGGARGIGRALSQAFLARGCEIVAVGRNRAELDAFAAEHPGRVHAWPCDLANTDDVDALVRALPTAHPTLSLIVNNAGVQNLNDYLGEDVDALAPALRREIAVNLDAVVRLSTGLLPHLRAQESAGIVNVTSALAIAPKASAPVYCATKAGVRAFTKALRYQCEDRAPSVAVFEVMFGLVDTDMTAGRGRGKISAEAAAAQTLAGLERGAPLIPIAQAKLVLRIARVAPGLAEKILRNS